MGCRSRRAQQAAEATPPPCKRLSESRHTAPASSPPALPCAYRGSRSGSPSISRQLRLPGDGSDAAGRGASDPGRPLPGAWSCAACSSRGAHLCRCAPAVGARRSCVRHSAPARELCAPGQESPGSGGLCGPPGPGFSPRTCPRETRRRLDPIANHVPPRRPCRRPPEAEITGPARDAGRGRTRYTTGGIRRSHPVRRPTCDDETTAARIRGGPARGGSTR
jgi:hypothetical protein